MNLRGRLWENMAAEFLKRQQVTILQRNVHSRFGEIDLICRHDEFLCFVEVRYRRQKDFGGSSESVEHHKQRKIIATANWFLSKHPQYSVEPCRFDVVAISGVLPPRIEWIKNAFQS